LRERGCEAEVTARCKLDPMVSRQAMLCNEIQSIIEAKSFELPTNASFHHSYGGRPSRGTPGDELTVFATSSVVLNRAMSAFARVIGSLRVSQTGLLARGPLTQSGNAAFTGDAAYKQSDRVVRATRSMLGLKFKLANQTPLYK
jgi:hypothetical protein